MSYVQIGTSRVRLETWEDILLAVGEGLLDERSYCELKKGLPPPGQNTEVSRDLASFTVEGGVMVYGISDAGAGRAGEVVGIADPESAKTRLVGIAMGKVSPAMVCDVRVVMDPDDSARGCVIVEIPPSPIAPHQADERYWGRSSEGKRVLPEPHVANIFATRRNRDDGLNEHLLGLAGTFDPVPARDRSHGHLYFTAVPLTPPVGPPPWDHNKRPMELAVEARFPAHEYGGGDLTSLNYTETHPRGIMATSVSDRELDELYAKRLLIRDTGGVDFAAGLGTRSRYTGGNSPKATVVPLSVVLIHVDQCVRLTAHVARLRSDSGTWHLGVHMTSLLGVPSGAALDERSFERAAKYPEETFTNDVYAPASEMSDSPQRVVEALMTPLARGLGALRAFPYESPVEFMRRNV
ncbi:AlbA family DNA-binding domain-containing protein [Nocardioides zeicaulis]|uniref:Helix-turn-helix domain-containing protein n=1 Tax=Nocardioides zeicaulis TaxID=1776857 RepID=A0ABV6DWS1_9ACTN